MANKVLLTDDVFSDNDDTLSQAEDYVELLSNNNRFSKGQIKQLRSLLMRYARLNRGLTQKYISEHIGIYQSSYCNIEKKGIKSSYLEQIANLLGIPVELLKEPSVHGVQKFIKDTSSKQLHDIQDHTAKKPKSRKVVNLDELITHSTELPSSSLITKMRDFNDNAPKGLDFDESLILLLVTPHQINIILQSLQQLLLHYKNPERVLEIQNLYKVVSDSYKQMFTQDV